jgi:hypothetical protein
VQDCRTGLSAGSRRIGISFPEEPFHSLLVADDESLNFEELSSNTHPSADAGKPQNSRSAFKAASET